MKIKITVVAALVAAVGCGAFAADVGAKVNGTALPSDTSGNVQCPVGDGVTPGKNMFAGLAVPVKGEKGYYILKPK